MITFEIGNKRIMFIAENQGVRAKVSFLDRFGKASFGVAKYAADKVKINGRVSTELTGRAAQQLLMNVSKVATSQEVIQITTE